MPLQPIPQSGNHNLSSTKGRQWLQNFCQKSATSSAREELVFSIPDVTPETTSVKSSTTGIVQGLDDSLSTESNSSQSIVFQPQVPSSDLPEPAEDWATTKTENEPARQPKETASPDKSAADEKLDSLLDSIFERFPLDAPTLLLFVGSEKNIHTNEATARVASLLASKMVGQVLLVDSDLESQELTKASGLLSQPGVSDLVNNGVHWETLIYGGGATNLEFMPSGAVPFAQKLGKKRIQQAVLEMKKKFQFICVAGGDAHLKSAKHWTDVCDGSYLLVSQKNTHESFARSAVTELQTSGARLLGCIVSDTI